MERTSIRTRDKTLLAFLGVVLLGGGSTLAVRFTVLELDPFWGGAIRFIPASTIFFVLAIWRRVPLPRGRALVGDLVYGILFFAVGFGFIYWGVQEAGAATLQVVLACIPQLTLLFAVTHRLEVFTARGLVGASLTIAGFVFVFRDQVQAAVSLTSLVALVIGVIAFAEATVSIKWFPRTDPIAKNAIAMALGGGFLLLISVFTNEDWRLPVRSETWAAVVYLVVFGSVLVFSLILFVVNRWTASAASYQFVLYPFASVPLSMWLLDERITVTFVGGAVLTIIGVYVGAFSGKSEVSPAR